MNELQIIGNIIVFRGFAVASLSKIAPALLMEDFRDNFNKLILLKSQTEELRDILDKINQATSSIESNLSYFKGR